MSHRADALNDIFENNVLIRETCTARRFIGDGSGLSGLISNIDGGSANSVFLISQLIDGGSA